MTVEPSAHFWVGVTKLGFKDVGSCLPQLVLPQVFLKLTSGLWIVVLRKLGHAPINTSHFKKILLSLLLLAPTSQKVEVGGTCLTRKECTSPHPGMRKHSLQYDWRPDFRFGWRLGWNIGSLNGKGDVCEELRKKMINVCCLQELR